MQFEVSFGPHVSYNDRPVTFQARVEYSTKSGHWLEIVSVDKGLEIGHLTVRPDGGVGISMTNPGALNDLVKKAMRDNKFLVQKYLQRPLGEPTLVRATWLCQSKDLKYTRPIKLGSRIFDSKGRAHRYANLEEWIDNAIHEQKNEDTDSDGESEGDPDYSEDSEAYDLDSELDDDDIAHLSEEETDPVALRRARKNVMPVTPPSKLKVYVDGHAACSRDNRQLIEGLAHSSAGMAAGLLLHDMGLPVAFYL